MNTKSNSSLIQFNNEIENIEDDNFESISFNSDKNNNDINIENNQQIIEKFSNNAGDYGKKSSCGVAYGDQIRIMGEDQKNETILDINTFKFNRVSRYPQKVYIHPVASSAKKGDSVKYGDKVMLSTSPIPYRFEYNSRKMKWSQHDSEAKRRGGHLASINSYSDWIQVYRKPGYIGGIRKKNPPDHLTRRKYGTGAQWWYWSDGSPYTYEAWARHEPNQWFGNGTPEDRIEITGRRDWNDIPGERYRRQGWYKIPNSKLIFTIGGGQKGLPITYKDQFKINEKNISGLIYKEPGAPCNIRRPLLIKDGDYRIKEIKVRCDDKFDMFINGTKYSGSGWRRTFTFRWSKENQPINNKKGYVIAFRSYNYAGPGCLIAQIELYNGSFIVTDGDWYSSQTVRDITKFIYNTNNYNIATEFREPQVIGPNKPGELRWDGRVKRGWDKYFVDGNFSEHANWISSGSVFKKGWTYHAVVVGDVPKNTRCRHTLSFGEALCYVEKYPDIKNWILNNALVTYRYTINRSRARWVDHYRHVRNKGGNLASIHNREQQNKIYRLLVKSNVGTAWIGGIRRSYNRYDRSSRNWRWSDGSHWNYQNFKKNYEPNNWRYREWGVHMIRSWGGAWNDLSMSARIPAIYQYRVPGDQFNLTAIVNLARWHWKNFGCTFRENRNFDCVNPPRTVGNYNHVGCISDKYDGTLIPEKQGNVTSLAECGKIAEKNESMVFGAINGKDCYTGGKIKDIKKRRQKPSCPTLGTIGGFQAYYRKMPFDPKKPVIDDKNFHEKFTNQKDNRKYYILIALLVLIILLMYCYLK